MTLLKSVSVISSKSNSSEQSFLSFSFFLFFHNRNHNTINSLYLSFLLGLMFFLMIPLVSLGFEINPQVSWDMMMVVMMKGEEDQTIEEGFDLW